MLPMLHNAAHPSSPLGCVVKSGGSGLNPSFPPEDLIYEAFVFGKHRYKFDPKFVNNAIQYLVLLGQN